MHNHSAHSFSPLPGTVPQPRAFFIDRWGTLLETPAAGFAKGPEEVRFFDGALDALFRASQAGWKLYLLGNEDAVAFGHLERSVWEGVEAEIVSQLTSAGVSLTRNYACTEHPEGVSGQRTESVYLLPNTGAFYHAMHTDGVDLTKSWVIGDSTLELVAGWRAGCRLAAVRTGLSLSDAKYAVDPEMTGDGLRDILVELVARSAALHS